MPPKDRPKGLRAVLSAPRLALDGTVGRIGTFGVAVAAAVLAVTTYLAIASDPSMPLFFAWRKLRLFPWLADLRMNPLGTFIETAGRSVALLVLLSTTGAQVKALFRHCKGDLAFTSGEAWHASRRNTASLVTVSALLVLLSAAALLAVALLGLGARIPAVGEVLAAIGLLFSLPFAACVLACMVLLGGTLTMGVAVTNTLDDDWLGTLLSLGALIWAQWWRFFWYEVVAALVVFAAWAAAMAALFSVVAMAVVVAGMAAGGKVAAVAFVASRLVPGMETLLEHVVPRYDSLGILVGPATAVGGGLIAVAMLFLFAVAAGYATGVWSAAQMSIYAELRRRQYSHSIYEQDDMIDRAAVLAARPPAPEDEKSAGGLKPPAPEQ